MSLNPIFSAQVPSVGTTTSIFGSQLPILTPALQAPISNALLPTSSPLATESQLIDQILRKYTPSTTSIKTPASISETLSRLQAAESNGSSISTQPSFTTSRYQTSVASPVATLPLSSQYQPTLQYQSPLAPVLPSQYQPSIASGLPSQYQSSPPTQYQNKYTPQTVFVSQVAQPTTDTKITVFRDTDELRSGASANQVLSPSQVTLANQVCQDLVKGNLKCDYGLLEASIITWNNIQSFEDYQRLVMAYLDNRAYLPSQRGLFVESYPTMPKDVVLKLRELTRKGVIATNFLSGIPSANRTFFIGVASDKMSQRLVGIINNTDGYYASYGSYNNDAQITGINRVDMIIKQNYRAIKMIDTIKARENLLDIVLSIIA